jgi:hypothetical protein
LSISSSKSRKHYLTFYGPCHPTGEGAHSKGTIPKSRTIERDSEVGQQC